MSPTPEGQHHSSFRDPAGFIFTRDGTLYRQINACAKADFLHLHESGLYKRLIEKRLLVPHEEVDGKSLTAGPDVFRVIRPERVAFISHPSEWSFGQLRDSALATVEIQSLAMDHGMRLKDASAYNIQLHHGRPTLIDTLSFEIADGTQPWPAYHQFCKHFLAPLALMSRCDIRLGGLLQTNLDGIPLDLASRLLPWRSWLSFQLLMHLHLHARAQSSLSSDATPSATGRTISTNAARGILDGLKSAVEGLSWTPAGTTWFDYYQKTNYSAEGLADKTRLVETFIDRASPKTVWDLGANTGVFSRLAARRGIPTVAWDIDPAAVELNYRTAREKGETGIHPLLLDLTNPTPAFGWNHTERASFADRGPVDLAMALALIHHLVIGNNLPLERVADFFARICRHLIIEFVPKEDSQVQRLLAVRKDIFPGYVQQTFETVMEKRFLLVSREPIPDTKRTLFLYKNRGEPC